MIISRFLVLTILFFSNTIAKANDLLCLPRTIMPQEYAQLKKIRLHTPVSFCWQDPLFEFHISYSETHVNFTLDMSQSVYNELPVVIKQQCLKSIKITDAEHKFPYSYTYGLAQQHQPVLPQGLSPSYYIAPPYHSQSDAQLITIEELAHHITQKRVLFYTGAGISASAVPSMQKLEYMIGFVRDGRRPNGVKTITTMISHPETVAQNFACFVQTAINAPPTPAHRALTLLAQYAKTTILTENIDLLHQAAGVEPLFAGTQKAHNACTIQNLTEIDLCICVGLSHDDRGFIAQYKHYNPQAKIVALDYIKPDYLDSHDMLLQGDVQVSLPLLWNKIETISRSKL